MVNCWPANEHAPYCGCQVITREHNMINTICSATFTGEQKVHMLSVASSYPIPEESDSLNNKFVWTGYNGVSYRDMHDIVYFFEKEDCVDLSGDVPDYSIDMSTPDWIPTINCTLSGMLKKLGHVSLTFL